MVMGCFFMICIIFLLAAVGSVFGPGGAILGALLGVCVIAKLNGR